MSENPNRKRKVNNSLSGEYNGKKEPKYDPTSLAGGPTVLAPSSFSSFSPIPTGFSSFSHSPYTLPKSLSEPSCAEEVIYQDENICILNPNSHTAKTKGVEVIHAFGYMPAISGSKSSLVDAIAKEGLKTSKQLIMNKYEIESSKSNLFNKSIENIYKYKDFNLNNKSAGIKPSYANKKMYNTLKSNNSVQDRLSFYSSDSNQYRHVYLRPPSIAPYKLDSTGNIISAGNWREFIGKENEHSYFFHHKLYKSILLVAADLQDVSEGLVTLRVDPDLTYVYSEDAKNPLTNVDKETGILRPGIFNKNEVRHLFYKASRTKLSDLLTYFENNPALGGDSTNEIIVTPDNPIPPCAFEKILQLKNKPGGEYTVFDYNTGKEFEEIELPNDKELTNKIVSDHNRIFYKSKFLNTIVNSFANNYGQGTSITQIDNVINKKEIVETIITTLKLKIKEKASQLRESRTTSEPVLDVGVELSEKQIQDKATEISKFVMQKKKTEGLVTVINTLSYVDLKLYGFSKENRKEEKNDFIHLINTALEEITETELNTMYNFIILNIYSYLKKIKIKFLHLSPVVQKEILNIQYEEIMKFIPKASIAPKLEYIEDLQKINKEIFPELYTFFTQLHESKEKQKQKQKQAKAQGGRRKTRKNRKSHKKTYKRKH
jgi:hypothetical protein